MAFEAANQNVSAGNTTALTLTGEVVDTAEMHSTSINTHQIVVATAGWYLVFGHAMVTSNNNGTALLHLRVGGSVLSPPVYDSFVTAASNFEDQVLRVMTYINLSASSVVDMAGQAVTNDFGFSDKKLTVIGPIPAP